MGDRFKSPGWTFEPGQNQPVSLTDFLCGRIMKGMETLDLSSALEMLGGEKELLIELLKAFVSGERLDGAKLERLASLPDRTEAAKYVHFYKGAARQLAAQKLSASGQALEDVLRGRKAGDIAALSKAYLADYEEAFEAIEGSLAVL